MSYYIFKTLHDPHEPVSIISCTDINKVMCILAVGNFAGLYAYDTNVGCTIRRAPTLFHHMYAFAFLRRSQINALVKPFHLDFVKEMKLLIMFTYSTIFYQSICFHFQC